jgi:hypothetical protein
VSSTPRPLYPEGKSPRYQLDRRPSFDDVDKFVDLTGTSAVQPVASLCTDCTSRLTTPCGGRLEYLDRSPCES